MIAGKSGGRAVDSLTQSNGVGEGVGVEEGVGVGVWVGLRVNVAVGVKVEVGGIVVVSVSIGRAAGELQLIDKRRVNNTNDHLRIKVL